MLQANIKLCWIDPLINYLGEGALLVDQKEAHKVRHQASNYVLHEGSLYGRSLSLPLLNASDLLRPILHFVRCVREYARTI